MKPAVSAVMATHNYARYLPVSIESVRAQTFTDWELVIVDDGSTDDTQKVLRAYQSDPRIRVIHSDRLGQTRAKNLGVRLSRADKLAFLDADDAWFPTKLERQLELMTPDVGAVYCAREFMDGNGDRIDRPNTLAPYSGTVLDQLFVQNFVCFSSTMIRRSVYDHVGGFNPLLDLAIDYDFWLRIAQHYEFQYVPEVMVRYRTGHGNLSQKLADRVAIANSIMTRDAHAISPHAVAEGFASTARTMGWVLRRSEPRTALRWYLRALAWPHRRVDSLKGCIISLSNMMRGLREPTAAENLSINI